MDTVLDKIASDRAKYNCNVKTLGECKIASPVRHHDFIRDGQRVLLTGDMGVLEAWEAKLGHKPSFELLLSAPTPLKMVVIADKLSDTLKSFGVMNS